MTERDTAEIRFTLLDTPVRAKPAFFANLLALWGFLSWLAGRRRPERLWPARLIVGALSTVVLLVADLGHALAHSVSARYAAAPMDEILLAADMPRTIYQDDDVPPSAHRLRASGGPLYSALGLLSSLALRSAAPRDSLAHELAHWSCLGHGLILAGSLMPLPIVDGGVLLKWTLVEGGQTADEADQIVKQAGLSLGAAATATAAAMAARRRWLPALGLVAGGAIAIAAALDKLR
jgi:hypothetical protein